MYIFIQIVPEYDTQFSDTKQDDNRDRHKVEIQSTANSVDLILVFNFI